MLDFDPPRFSGGFGVRVASASTNSIVQPQARSAFNESLIGSL